MDDTQRVDNLAQMGLAAIMRAFDAHPQPVQVFPKDILPKVKGYDIASDQGGESERSKQRRIHVARALLENMIDEGIFRGQNSIQGVATVLLVRPSLTDGLLLYGAGPAAGRGSPWTA